MKENKMPTDKKLLDEGMKIRRKVLGDAHVDRSMNNANDFNRDFQEYITQAAWGLVWTREGLDLKTRSLIVLAITASLGRWEEFILHLKATQNTGLTKEEVKEVLIQLAVYAGVPAANTAFKEAKEYYDSLETGEK
jgi:4-carboxymuconolactone decarboxylase